MDRQIRVRRGTISKIPGSSRNIVPFLREQGLMWADSVSDSWADGAKERMR